MVAASRCPQRVPSATAHRAPEPSSATTAGRPLAPRAFLGYSPDRILASLACIASGIFATGLGALRVPVVLPTPAALLGGCGPQPGSDESVRKDWLT